MNSRVIEASISKDNFQRAIAEWGPFRTGIGLGEVLEISIESLPETIPIKIVVEEPVMEVKEFG